MSASSSSGTAVNVTAVIDGGGFGAVPLRVTVLGLLVLVLDGFDIQAVGFAAPALVTAWGVDRAALAPALAAGLVGMAIGAVMFSWFGDRRGRKGALVFSTLLIALGSLLSTQVDNLQELLLCRLLTGIGLGAPLPIVTALLTELIPLRWRNLAVAVSVVGVPIGGMTGAAFAQYVIPAFGWPAIFWIGGILPTLLALALALWLPESPKYLARQPEKSGQLAQLLNRITGGQHYQPSDRFFIEEPPATGKAPVLELFTPRYRATTAVLWLAFITNIFMVFVYVNWLPTLLASTGMSLALALRCSLAFNIGGVLGSLAGVFAVNRYGSRRVVRAVALLSAAATGVLGWHPVFDGNAGALPTLLLAVFVIGACLNTVQVSLYTLAAFSYATALRATGVGAAAGFSRIGAIASTVAGASVFALGLAAPVYFAALAGVSLLTFCAVTLLRVHVPPRPRPNAG
jgi:MFS transporter, AAHS family, 4-hydroxybenzoate transporter